MVIEPLNRKSMETQMQITLERLGIPLKVALAPNPNKPIHGEINHSILVIFDCDESDAWATFHHEVIEYKLKEVTKVYRTLINSLIDGYEKLAYQEKEHFIEFIPHLLRDSDAH